MKIYPKLTKNELYWFNQVKFWSKRNGHYIHSVNCLLSLEIVLKLVKMNLIKEIGKSNSFYRIFVAYEDIPKAN